MGESSMKGWSGQYVWEPHVMGSRVSDTEGLSSLPTILLEPSADMLSKLERVREIMLSLPPREADFVDLYFFKQVKQTKIAAIFGVSQPTVCYRLQRATERIKFILSLPYFKSEQIEQDMKGVLSNPLDIQIMVLMYQTTCQSSVARALGVSQGLVRHRFIRSTKKLEPLPSMREYVRTFEQISKNLNILREIQRNPSETQVSHCVA
jgi:predicted DNA-binding protein (UPF0251 family)